MGSVPWPNMSDSYCVILHNAMLHLRLLPVVYGMGRSASKCHVVTTLLGHMTFVHYTVVTSLPVLKVCNVGTTVYTNTCIMNNCYDKNGVL